MSRNRAAAKRNLPTENLSLLYRSRMAENRLRARVSRVAGKNRDTGGYSSRSIPFVRRAKQCEKAAVERIETIDEAAAQVGSGNAQTEQSIGFAVCASASTRFPVQQVHLRQYLSRGESNHISRGCNSGRGNSLCIGRGRTGYGRHGFNGYESSHGRRPAR